MKKTGFIFLISFLSVRCSLHHPESNGIFHANKAHTGVYSAGDYKNFGKLIWKFRTGGKIFSSPVIVDGIVYVGSEDSNCYAISTATGELKWKFHTGGAVSSSPAVS